MAEAIADTSTVEGVVLPKAKDLSPTLQPTGNGGISVDHSNPVPGSNTQPDSVHSTEHIPVAPSPAPQNGVAAPTAEKQNGAAAPKDIKADQDGDKTEVMTKKESPETVKRVTKTIATSKPGSIATKAAGVGTSVKKGRLQSILTPGTFGSSQSKPPHTKPSSNMASSTKTPPTPTVKKTASAMSTSMTASKPPAAAKSTMTLASSTAARRTSMAPTSVKSLSSSLNSHPLSSSTASKATAEIVSPTTSVSPTAALRTSTTSASARPRASVSEGVPAKKPAAPRQSMTASKPAPSTGMRPLKTAGSASISSLKDVKEDGKAVHELETKYKEVTSSLKTNLEKVKALEAQVESTQATLTSVQLERDDKQRALEALKDAKDVLEQELAVAHQTIEGQKNEKQFEGSYLNQIKEELKAAQESTRAQIELVTTLQGQIKVVEAELASAKEALIVSKVSEAAAEAASLERTALMKANADLENAKAESEAFVASQLKVQAEASERIKVLEAEVERLPGLTMEVSHLRRQKEEAEGKLSEVEIEVLELRETAEKASDALEKASTRVKTTEQELAAAGKALADANEASKVKEHDHNNVLENMKELQLQLQAALDSHKKAQDDLQAKEAEHAGKLAEVERVHIAQSEAATEETKRLAAELELQESKYDSRLEEAKAEHALALEQMFQKAKSEAGLEHSQELQNLRAQSQVTIEQLRQAHQVSLDDAKASHEEALEIQVKGLEKQIANLKLELKATQDDLSKAKAGLEAALVLEGTLRSQLEQKDAEFANAPIDQSDEVARLAKELANAKDDLANLTEAFNASKESFKQISSNHQTELEEAAKGRAEEVTKLRTSHEDEINTYKKEREELVSRISELEVELTTLKASAEAPPPAPMSPRKDANGTAGGSAAVTKEELQRMHEAHNLKIHELEAGHEQLVKQLQEKLDQATQEAADQRKHAEHLQMEVNFAEQTAEENEDELKQLRDEIEQLKAQLHGNGEA